MPNKKVVLSIQDMADLVSGRTLYFDGVILSMDNEELKLTVGTDDKGDLYTKDFLNNWIL